MNRRPSFLIVLTAFLLLASACITEVQAPTATPSPPPVGGLLPGDLGGKVGSGLPSAETIAPTGSLAAPYSVVSVSPQQAGLWVSGQGTVSAAPDVALLQVGVEAQDKTVSEAQRRVREAMNAVVKVLQDGGVAEKDIKTTSFNIYQVTRWIDREGREEIIAYRVSHMASVKVRTLDKVGALIDAVAEAGGNLTRIHGISFAVDDPGPHLAAAREKAVKDALAKARQIAQIAELTLGKPIYITENVSYTSPIVYRSMALAEKDIAAAPTTISPGENEFSASVQMAFALE